MELTFFCRQSTGIWHGASRNFILWGALYGVIIIVEKLLSIPQHVANKVPLRVFYQIFTMLMVVFGWVLFRAVDLSSATEYLKAMLGMAPGGWIDALTVRRALDFAIVLIAGLICSMPLIAFVKNKISASSEKGTVACDVCTYVVQGVLFVVSVSFIVMNAHNPFIYFNF